MPCGFHKRYQSTHKAQILGEHDVLHGSIVQNKPPKTLPSNRKESDALDLKIDYLKLDMVMNVLKTPKKIQGEIQKQYANFVRCSKEHPKNTPWHVEFAAYAILRGYTMFEKNIDEDMVIFCTENTFHSKRKTNLFKTKNWLKSVLNLI